MLLIALVAASALVFFTEWFIFGIILVMTLILGSFYGSVYVVLKLIGGVHHLITRR